MFSSPAHRLDQFVGMSVVDKVGRRRLVIVAVPFLVSSDDVPAVIELDIDEGGFYALLVDLRSSRGQHRVSL